MRTIQKRWTVSLAAVAILAGSVGGYHLMASRPAAATQVQPTAQTTPGQVPFREAHAATGMVPPPPGWKAPTEDR